MRRSDTVRSPGLAPFLVHTHTQMVTVRSVATHAHQQLCLLGQRSGHGSAGPSAGRMVADPSLVTFRAVFAHDSGRVRVCVCVSCVR